MNDKNPRKNHFWLMVLCCIGPILLIIGLLLLFKIKLTGDYWAWLFILLCPIAHLWLMKGHHHREDHKE